MADFYSFQSMIEKSIEAEKSLQPRLIDGYCHTNLADSTIVCRLPRRRKSSEIIFVFLQDFKRNWFAQYTLISPRVQSLLQEIGATGYELRDVADMRLGFEHAPEDRAYKQLVTLGWGGLPAEESGVKRIKSEFGEFCFSRCTNPGKLLDRNQWDGTDFFRIWPVGVWITERVYKVLSKNRIKHVYLAPMESMNCEPLRDGVTTFVGKPLRLIYPEDRAQEIGQPLNIYWWNSKEK
ncbi:hypothetical protein AB1K70_26160 [Bremerella sp. JC770]|uniref:hypothetical protein n=1 Tax=Bremerella sp. JC770 TaxID=3232137 RepID=UPI00345AF128